MITIKKYSNRRLYDTSQSKYVTLDELAVSIRNGADVKVVDAKTSEDLTQGVLAQIIIESRGAGKLLPTNMLTQLIRMEDDALSEFFGQYMSWALSMYLRMKQTSRQISPFHQGNASPFGAQNAFSQWLGGMYNWPGFQQQQPDFGQGFEAMAQNMASQNMAQNNPQGMPSPPPPPPQYEQQASAPEPQPTPEPAPEPEVKAEPEKGSEVSQMRQELDELKELLKQVALNQAKGN